RLAHWRHAHQHHLHADHHAARRRSRQRSSRDRGAHQQHTGRSRHRDDRSEPLRAGNSPSRAELLLVSGSDHLRHVRSEPDPDPEGHPARVVVMKTILSMILKAALGWFAGWIGGYLQRKKLASETARADTAEQT